MRAANFLLLACILVFSHLDTAGDTAPQQIRQAVMKDVRQAAKPVGNMLRGNEDFNAETLMKSLGVFFRKKNMK